MKGILIGNAQNEHTGVTVILAPGGVTGGVDVRGGAPGTRETDLLRAENTVDKINAVVLTGGSAFGLDSCSGVMRFLYEKGCGYAAGKVKVPIVCGAVLFDITDETPVYPTAEMGYSACLSATESGFETGGAGAGRGATVGKALGPKNAEKGGLGYYSLKLGGTEVAAIVAVNALGDVYNESGKIIAGTKSPVGGHLNTEKAMLSELAVKMALKAGGNTTIGVILTTAKLTKAQANKLCGAGHDAYSRAIRPVHTPADGDTVFCMATGETELDFTLLYNAAAVAMRRAVENAVKK